MKNRVLIVLLLGILIGTAGLAWSAEIDYGEIVTMLPPDAIAAILNPKHVTIGETVGFMNDSEKVLGVSINGQSRAYPINALSTHEIVNDFVGGVKIAVTW